MIANAKNRNHKTPINDHPCPFCGREQSARLRIYGAQHYVVDCLGCLARGPIDLDPEQACERWNRVARPPRKPSPGEHCQGKVAGVIHCTGEVYLDGLCRWHYRQSVKNTKPP